MGLKQVENQTKVEMIGLNQTEHRTKVENTKVVKVTEDLRNWTKVDGKWD